MSNLKGIHDYTIAEHPIRIEFLEDGRNDTRLLPSFAPFEIEGRHEEETLFFQLTVDDTMRPEPKERRERIRKFDTGNGETVVDLVDDGGYQYIIKDINGAECCLLRSDKEFRRCRCALNGNYNMRSFGLNNALMLIFAFAGSRHDTLLIHASLVRQNGYGYAFIAKSGTGKSTHVSLWLRHLPGCDLMNDDNPIVRIIDGEAYIFGGPWSGKTPCYRNVKARLGAITRIDRAPANSIERLAPIEAFASFLPSCSSMKWDEDIFNRICNTVTKIIETTAIYTLHCLPNEEAAILCNKTISK
ncbi:MAG: hypothetical protein IJJ98_10395 [Prevotella sp.]|jgi:hypothetical protein|nr:hypothetical protein [Prevotella sp.]MBR0527091.1 hypothetical protein [Prevotella sp.]MBR3010143.1 hypothetical protein [Prevotella sp.]